MKASDQYLKIVEWSEEDQCYVGTCPGLMLGGIHGDNEAKVFKELCQAVEEWINIYEQNGDPLPDATAGKEYSGKFVVRVGKDLHKSLAIGAMCHGRKPQRALPPTASRRTSTLWRESIGWRLRPDSAAPQP